MRNWIFHPLIFYPLVALLAVLVIAISLRPQSWPRAPAPTAAAAADGPTLVFQGNSFNAPDVVAADQNIYVPRNFLGQPQSLHIAVLPEHTAPTPAERGARILLTARDAQHLEGRSVTVEVSYNPLPVNAASGLAVSLQGQGPVAWVSRPAEAETGVLRFDLPAARGVNAIGLRAIAQGNEQAHGLEITRIRVTPHA
jgi:hypothetical protein